MVAHDKLVQNNPQSKHLFIFVWATTANTPKIIETHERSSQNTLEVALL